MADSTSAEFWDVRYAAGITPWDAGCTPATLRAFVSSLSAPRRALVPGCGSGYEVGLLAEMRWEVLAIDISAVAIERARATLGTSVAELREADFFAFDGDEVPFDVVYERAFLCALPPRIWSAYATRVAQLIRPGGFLAGYFFVTETVSGPPFGISQDILDELLADAFVRVADSSVEDSLPVFAGRERWQVWQRLGDPPLLMSVPTERPDRCDPS